MAENLPAIREIYPLIQKWKHRDTLRVHQTVPMKYPKYTGLYLNECREQRYAGLARDLRHTASQYELAFRQSILPVHIPVYLNLCFQSIKRMKYWGLWEPIMTTQSTASNFIEILLLYSMKCVWNSLQPPFLYLFTRLSNHVWWPSEQQKVACSILDWEILFNISLLNDIVSYNLSQ